MKDQYTGDINDFRKYGLLRIIQEVTKLQLGICWLKTPDDGRSDGEFRNYLDRAETFRNFDPPLFDALRNTITTKKERTIKNILHTGVLGNVISFDEIVPDDRSGRDEFQRRGMVRLQSADLVFFDPDNGLDVKSRLYGRKNSSKYIYMHELEQYYSRGQSLLIYQHFPRVERTKFIREKSEKLRQRLNAPSIISLQTSHVVYFLVSHQRHAKRVAGLKEKVEVRWDGQFRCGVH